MANGKKVMSPKEEREFMRIIVEVWQEDTRTPEELWRQLLVDIEFELWREANGYIIYD